MTFPAVVALALALAMDALAVAIGVSIGLKKVSFGHVFRVAWHFGMLQFAMPLAGYYLGQAASSLIYTWADPLASIILCVIGLRMIASSFGSKQEEEKGSTDPTRGVVLFTLMFATSIDALAAGVSLSLVGTAVFTPAVVIGVVALLLSAVGMLAGPRIGIVFGKRAEALGGFGLILLGLKILFV